MKTIYTSFTVATINGNKLEVYGAECTIKIKFKTKYKYIYHAESRQLIELDRQELVNVDKFLKGEKKTTTLQLLTGNWLESLDSIELPENWHATPENYNALYTLRPFDFWL